MTAQIRLYQPSLAGTAAKHPGEDASDGSHLGIRAARLSKMVNGKTNQNTNTANGERLISRACLFCSSLRCTTFWHEGMSLSPLTADWDDKAATRRERWSYDGNNISKQKKMVHSSLKIYFTFQSLKDNSFVWCMRHKHCRQTELAWKQHQLIWSHSIE